MKTILLLGTLFLAPMLFAQSIYDIPLKDIHGKDTSLKQHKGKVLLIVNVASKCGNTPQYKGLEDLYAKNKDKGLVVLGFPCNQFGGQEPGSNAEILEFCSKTYSVTFPMFDKLDVKGPKQHPLYQALSGKESPFPGDVSWNFGKFLVGRDGKILKRIDPRAKVESPEVAKSIEDALAAK
jgi:glutathione peroxidase